MTKWMTLIAVGYPLGLAAAAFAAMQFDPHAIFNPYYMLATLVVVPALLLTFTVLIGRTGRSPGWTWVGMLGLWVLIVTGGHFWFIAATARSI